MENWSDKEMDTLPISSLLHFLSGFYMKCAAKEMLKYDLKPPVGRLLMLIHTMDHPSQRELADYMHFTPPTVTVMLTKLEQKGLVIRTQDDQDQRVTHISLTDEGEACLNRTDKSWKALDEALFEGISQDECDSMRSLLIKMIRNLQNSCHRKDENK